jgi:hypothetical protein
MQSNVFKYKSKIVKVFTAGPAKYGVFIFFCILVVVAFESLGLDNREKNLELRSVTRLIKPVAESKKEIEDSHFNPSSVIKKIEGSNMIETENKRQKMMSILTDAAIDQAIKHQSSEREFIDL